MNTPKPEPPGDEKAGAKPPGPLPPGVPGGVEPGAAIVGGPAAGKELPKSGEAGGAPKPAVPAAAGPTAGGPGPAATGPTPRVVRAGTPPKPGEKKPVFVLPSTKKRDVIVTILVVIVVVFFIAWGVHKMATEKPENLLEGVIVEKTVAEPLYGVSTKGVNEVDTGYHLRVQVGDRFYLLATLSQKEWMSYKVGDHIKFMRPIAEQK